VNEQSQTTFKTRRRKSWWGSMKVNGCVPGKRGLCAGHEMTNMNNYNLVSESTNHTEGKEKKKKEN